MSNTQDNKDKPLITRDWLAIERTKLANERTFLAYFRTFLVILGTGVTIIKLEFLSDLKTYGIILIPVSTIILLIGIYRLFRVRKVIRQHYS
jgi:putative membrane protein